MNIDDDYRHPEYGESLGFIAKLPILCFKEVTFQV